MSLQQVRYQVVPDTVLYSKIEWEEGVVSTLRTALDATLDPDEHIIDCTFKWVKKDKILSYFAAYTNKRHIKLLSTTKGKDLWNKRINLKH